MAETEHQQQSSDLWQQSPYAIGPSAIHWKDQEIGDCSACLSVSGCCCRWGCGRVGNMVVLAERGDRLLWTLGPYWPVLFFVTVPFLSALSVFTFLVCLRGDNVRIEILIVWGVCTVGMFASILGVSCRDPGILRRHTEPPDDTWIWSDQAKTFRPPGAKYDSECAVVIRQFDHTCPWTGTAIGEDNMCAFRLFLGFVFATIIMDAMLITVLR